MTASEIISDIKKRKLKPLYLLHGEEPYFIDLVSDFTEENLLSDAEKGFNHKGHEGRPREFSSCRSVFVVLIFYQIRSGYADLALQDERKRRQSRVRPATTAHCSSVRRRC